MDTRPSAAATRRPPIDPVLLLDDWGRIARVMGRIPTKADYTRRKKYSLGALLRQFGDWSTIPAAFVEHARRTRQWGDVLEFMLQPAVTPPPDAQPATIDLPIAPPAVNPRPGRARDGRYTDRPVCGPPLDIYGLRHAPANECGVIFLFGAIARRLDFLIESFQTTAFPDCIAKHMTAPGIWQTVRIEFEYESRNFHIHRHDPAQCDIIVCWEHNWKECPESMEVIALKDILASPPLGRA